MTTITIPKKITQGEDLIIVRRSDYEILLRRLAEVADAFMKIRKGEQELKKGKTQIVKSLKELNS